MSVEPIRDLAVLTGRPFADLQRERDLADDIAGRTETNRIIFAPEKWMAEEAARPALDAMVANAIPDLAHLHSPVVFDVWTAFAELVPALHLLPERHEIDNADWHWAKVRCVLAGAGRGATWDACVAILQVRYAFCPLVLTADESDEDWARANHTAHINCGWPLQIGWVKWVDACNVPCAVTDFCAWRFIIAVFHVLRHVRRCPTGDSVHVLYRQQAVEVSLSSNTYHKGSVGEVLKALKADKADEPLAAMLAHAVQVIGTSGLVASKSLADAPPDVLAGPWATLKPDPDTDGLCQFGLRLAGVWRAQNGFVLSAGADHDLISSIRWNLRTPDQHADARRAFARALPKTYTVASPCDIFFDYYENIDTSWVVYEDDTLPTAMPVLFDAPIFASLLRGAVPGLASEYPLIGFIAAEAAAAKTTDQGKSLAALTYSRAMVPSITLQGAIDGDSAPDSRALQARVITDGTLCIDEFCVASTKSHLLSRDHLQSLITGGSIAMGQVFANDPPPIKLRHSIVVAAKFLLLGEDLLNRVLPWYVDRLSPGQMSNHEAIERLDNGSAALSMRLAAWAMIQEHDIVKAMQTGAARSIGWRFRFHRKLAILLYQIRHNTKERAYSDDEAGEAIDLYLARLREHHREHTMNAEGSGIVSEVTEGVNVNVSLHQLFDGESVSGAELQFMYDRQESQGTLALSPAQFLRAYKDARQIAGVGLDSMLPMLGYKIRGVSDRAMSSRFCDSVRRVMPEESYWPIPGLLGESWQLHRRSDNNRHVRLSIEKRP